MICPRGFLELRIETLAPSRNAPIAVVCAGGTRSALAVKSLEALGYQGVVSVAGGVGGWSRAGFPLEHRKMLTNEQKARYARQIILPRGTRATETTQCRVLCIGAGGLGCPTTQYLGGGGGTIGIVDNDLADLSNLQRQILHGEDVSCPRRSPPSQASISLEIDLIPYEVRLDSSNVLEIFEGYDVVVDGTDNFPTRYLINDACVFLGIPNVHGSIFHFDGQVTVFNAPGGPCYRCLYPEPPPPELAPSCAEAGVLGAICGMVGSMQAAETMKLLPVQKPSSRSNTLGRHPMTVRELRLTRRTARSARGRLHHGAY